MDKSRGGYNDFWSKSFCLTVLNRFASDLFSVPLISVIEKFFAFHDIL